MESIQGKSIVVVRLVRTLKNKIHSYMASISKTVYINKQIVLY